jgi:L,D-transpeptidase YcbB
VADRRTILPAALALCSAAMALHAQSAPDLSAQITAAVSADPQVAHAASSDHGAAVALHAVYAGPRVEPLWSRDGRTTAQAEVVLRELQRAASYGLEPQDYGPERLLGLMPGAAQTADVARVAQFDVKLSAAALHFMSDLHYGRIDPTKAGFNLQGTRDVLDFPEELRGLAHSSNVSARIASFEPRFHHYAILKDALARYLSLAQDPELTELPRPPRGLKLGDSYAGARALRRLLMALGDLSPATAPDSTAGTLFDAQLSAGVRAFQLRHGLTADGLLGNSTFSALTIPLAERVRQIDLTLERWRWLPPFKTPPIIVNIPQFRLFAFRTTEDRVADILQMDVIVGRTFPRMQTPVFESDMRYLVFRPYWDIPTSILKNELLPKIVANPGYLAAQHLEIVRGQQDSSPVVAPTAESIAALAAGTLRLRQMPGEDNALGLVKFIFPNNYNVYLHSTPAHQLFRESRRAFSHGCIRVSDPVALAAYVLRDAPGDWSKETIEAAMNGDTPSLRVNLPQPINVLILYATALATEAGPTLFFEDIYGYDRKLERQLDLQPVR